MSGEGSTKEKVDVSVVNDSKHGAVLSQGDSVHQTRKRSWLNVARKHFFTRQKFKPVEVDGKENVVVPKEVS